MTPRLAIPDAFVLRGKRWRVRAMTRKDKRGKCRGCVGLCDVERRTIYLDARQSVREKERTFVHELVHALMPDGVISPEQEERIARSLEGPIRALVATGALSAEGT